MKKTCKKIGRPRTLRRMLCHVCGRVVKRYPVKVKPNQGVYCSRGCYHRGQVGKKRDAYVGEKIAAALRGVPHTEERRRNIGEAHRKRVPPSLGGRIKKLWSTGYIRDVAAIRHHTGEYISTRVYYNFIEENREYYDRCFTRENRVNNTNTFHFSLKTQMMPLDYVDVMLKELVTLRGTEFIRKYRCNHKTAQQYLGFLGESWNYSKGESYPEKLVRSWLEDNGIKHVAEYKLGTRRFDFKIEDRLLIEVNGDYWHCNPEVYDSPINKIQERNVKRDATKMRMAMNERYCLAIVWEKDVVYRREQCLSKLQKIIERYRATNEYEHFYIRRVI